MRYNEGDRVKLNKNLEHSGQVFPAGSEGKVLEVKSLLGSYKIRLDSGETLMVHDSSLE